MAETPRTILDRIDSFLADTTVPMDERRELWDILVGLRGPDRRREAKAVKHDVTGVIRAKAFPLMAEVMAAERTDFHPAMVDGSLREAAEHLQERGGHFATHAWRALLALARWTTDEARTTTTPVLVYRIEGADASVASTTSGHRTNGHA